jgi:hypothetical protein
MSIQANHPDAYRSLRKGGRELERFSLARSETDGGRGSLETHSLRDGLDDAD